jgi:hypothetical protein
MDRYTREALEVTHQKVEPISDEKPQVGGSPALAGNINAALLTIHESATGSCPACSTTTGCASSLSAAKKAR